MYEVKMSGKQSIEVGKTIGEFEKAKENGNGRRPVTAPAYKVSLQVFFRLLNLILMQFYAPQPPFNIAAPPFQPPKRDAPFHPILKVGPSKVPVNAAIWETVANSRVLPALPQTSLVRTPSPRLPIISPVAITKSPFFKCSDVSMDVSPSSLRLFGTKLIFHLFLFSIICRRLKTTTRATSNEISAR